MNTELIRKNIQDHLDLWSRSVMMLVQCLVGVISRSTRGVALNFDGETIQIFAVFDKEPSEAEMNDLQDIEAELVSSHNFMSDLEVVVIPSNQDISTLVKNWGWVYLRKEG